MVRFGMMPYPVPNDLITLLKEREGSAGAQDVPMRELQSGQRVSIEEKPLMKYEGVFLAETSQDRVLALLNIVGKAPKARADVTDVSPAED